MANEKYTLGYAKIIIAKFMELDSVQVGYADSEEETEWQRNNEEWMNTVGLTQVGRYFVSVKENKWHPWDDVKYDSSWSWLMPVVEKINQIWVNSVRGKQLEIEETYRAMQNRVLLCSILETVEHVYQFIQWYNQQKQTHDTR